VCGKEWSGDAPCPNCSHDVGEKPAGITPTPNEPGTDALRTGLPPAPDQPASPQGPTVTRPDDWLLARVIGVIYLTFCSGVGGGVYLFWAYYSRFARFGLLVALVIGLIAALVAQIPDPAASPIRWGLLWLVIGFAVGTGALYGSAYLWIKVLRWPLLML
jgi:hypothetical protein